MWLSGEIQSLPCLLFHKEWKLVEWVLEQSCVCVEGSQVVMSLYVSLCKQWRGCVRASGRRGVWPQWGIFAGWTSPCHLWEECAWWGSVWVCVGVIYNLCVHTVFDLSVCMWCLYNYVCSQQIMMLVEILNLNWDPRCVLICPQYCLPVSRFLCLFCKYFRFVQFAM